MASEKEEKKSSACDATPKPDIQEMRLGVWVLKIALDPSLIGTAGRKYHEDLRSAFPLFRRLAMDIYSVAPGYFILFVLCQIWQGVEDAILMGFSNRLLTAVEIGIKTGKPDRKEILVAIFARLFCSLIVAYFNWHGHRILRVLQGKVTRHYELFLMTADLQKDLPTSQKVGSKQEVTASQVWGALEQIINFLTQVVRVGSQLAFISHLFSSSGGPLFGLLSIAEPLFLSLYSESLWHKIFFAYVDNKDYERMHSLHEFTSSKYRQDIISGGLAPWILREYKQAHENLGEVSENHPMLEYGEKRSALFHMFAKGLGDLPIAFCALAVLFNIKGMSLVTFAVIQHSSMTLRMSVQMVFHQVQRFRKSLATVRALYTSPTIVNTLAEGDAAYPRADEALCQDATKGMSFSLRNISFSYPGSQSTVPALRNISLTIEPGQLIVIVGANGSGKSTLIRILSRLYDPDSGEIHIDGLPSKSYRIDDLHQATALLSQDTAIYPLSLAENIGLGFPERVSDRVMIEDAAKDGGALEFTNKLKDGIDTTLEPYVETFHHNLYDKNSHPLFEEMEKIRKKIDVSGGERQKVVAARSFMRFKSGKVKFVAVDEPSSALDADAELKLFEKLIAIRQGKTVIFVTHRFGHLTKYADQIICMKEGSIVEVGQHKELIEKKGEYANLYDIQASAFSQ